MAEPDAAGPAPTSGPEPRASKGSRSLTLADVQREMERATEPLRAAQRAAEAFSAPIRAAAEAHEKMLAPLRQMERDRQQIMAAINSGIGPALRAIVSAPGHPLLPAAPVQIRGPSISDAPSKPTRGPNGPRDPWPNVPASNPPAASTAVAISPASGFDLSPAAMSALVDRVAEEVLRRVSPPSEKQTAPSPPKQKSRRGRKQREISVGGPDAALEALAEEDPSVRVLAARALNERGIPYCRRTIENCDTYKAWRRDLEALRVEAAADGMADVLDAGLARIQKKKPGRGRLVDPTIDSAVEKMTKEFLRLHGEEGLDGQ